MRRSVSAGVIAAVVVIVVVVAAVGAYYYMTTRGGTVYFYLTDPGVQLSYRFMLPYGHRLIPVPPHPARDFIGLGGVQGHPRGPTP